jgi:hypothetical protein
MKALLVLLFVPVIAVAGKNALTGNVRMDLLSIMSADSLPQGKGIMVQSEVDRSKLKSPLLGGAMSLVIPGAGEFYSERFVKSGIFFAIEVAAVTAALVYNSRGNKKTDEFQTYADLHWSAVRYAKYIVAHGAPDYGPASANIAINENSSLLSWQQVDFGQINAWESGQHSEGFSHTLPPHGDQQYYELIGKYEQFKSGWDTYPTDSQGIPISDHNDYHGLVPQQMKDYAVERGKANDFYYLAETATAFIVLNHVLSALDGVWSTAHYNKEITSEVGMRLINIGRGEMTVATQLRVKVRL